MNVEREASLKIKLKEAIEIVRGELAKEQDRGSFVCFYQVEIGLDRILELVENREQSKYARWDKEFINKKYSCGKDCTFRPCTCKR